MKASEFSTLVPECCSEVLDAMYFTTVLESSHPAAIVEPGSVESSPCVSDHAFSLVFNGEVCGRFGVLVGDRIARSLASNFLGEDDADLSHQEIGEVVGELTNMLCGSVVSRVEGRSKFILSHPEPISTLPILFGVDALVSRLETDDGVITTWVIVEGTRGTL